MGINAIMMAEMCESVTFLDITPQILELLERISIVRRVGAGRTFRLCSRRVSLPLSPNRT
jgi:hypothetical protein